MYVLTDHTTAYFPSQQVSKGQTAVVTRADVSHVPARKKRVRT